MLPLVIGTFLTLFLAGVGATWKAATLRHSVIAEWEGRRSLAVGQLNQRAVEALIELQGQISAVLPSEDERFDPSRVVADPGTMLRLVSVYQLAIVSRERIDRYHGWALRVGPISVASCGFFLLGLLTGLPCLLISGLAGWIFLGLGLFTSGVFGLLVALTARVVSEHQMSSIEVVANAK